MTSNGMPIPQSNEMIFINGTPEAFPLNEIKMSSSNARPSKWKSQEKVKRHLNHIKMRLEKSMQIKNSKVLRLEKSSETIGNVSTGIEN
jgi:hypothetical protein